MNLGEPTEPYSHVSTVQRDRAAPAQPGRLEVMSIRTNGDVDIPLARRAHRIAAIPPSSSRRPYANSNQGALEGSA